MWNTSTLSGGDLKVIWRTCHRRQIKGPVEFDATIAIYVDDIIKMLNPESSSSVYVYLFIIILLSYVNCHMLSYP